MPKWEQWLDDEDDELELREEYIEVERIRKRPKKEESEDKLHHRGKKKQQED